MSKVKLRSGRVVKTRASATGSFGDRLRYHRTRAGLDQSQLAELIGCRRTTVCMIERSGSTTLARLRLTCAALNVTPNDLIPGEWS